MWHGFFNRFFFRFIPEFGWFEEGFAPRTEEGERMSSCVHTSSEKTLRDGVKKNVFFLGTLSQTMSRSPLPALNVISLASNLVI